MNMGTNCMKAPFVHLPALTGNWTPNIVFSKVDLPVLCAPKTVKI